MASAQPNNLDFPRFPPPPSHQFNAPPPPSQSFSPPPPPSHQFNAPPPPSHSFSPPPPPAPAAPHGHPPPPPHPFSPPPHVRPPPSPHHPPAPPPPHAHPPPAPVPPSPSPNHPTVIVVVLVSLGGLLCLSLLAFALFCCFQKRKKKTQEAEVIRYDEHKKIKETVVPGPFGQQAVVITVEDDVHIEEEIKKTEEYGHGGLHAESSSAEPGQGNSSSHEERTASPGRELLHHHHHHP